jgi:hypothetical protein
MAMRDVRQLGTGIVKPTLVLRGAPAIALALALVFALPVAAQYPGPPVRTMVNGRFLAPPPSVTSLAGRYLPPPVPSVTSIPNTGYRKFYPYFPYNGYYRGRGYGYGRGGYGYSYPVTYYVPMDSYGYDYVGGPDLYSGPPISPADPLMHMVADQPPVRYPNAEPEPAAGPPDYVPPAPPQQEPAARDAKPNAPSELVFRDGHKQEVSNYAIMGQTVYVFDARPQKVALTDLDVPATIKANDERGLDFNVPKQKPGQKKSDLELKVPADDKAKAPENIASVAP